MRRQRKWMAAFLTVVLSLGLLATPASADFENKNVLKNIDKTIATGDRASYAMDQQGATYGWGSNDKNRLGYRELRSPLEYGEQGVPKDPITHQSLVGVQFEGEPSLSSVGGWRLYDNGVVSRNDNYKGDSIAIYGDYYTTTGTQTDSPFTYLASGSIAASIKDVVRCEDYYMIIYNNGDLYTWGNPANGRTGTFSKRITSKLSGKEYRDDEPCYILSDVQAISAAKSMSYAVTTDGKIYEFGTGAVLTMVDGDTNQPLSNRSIDIVLPTESYVRQLEEIEGNLSKEELDEIKQDNLRTNSIQGKASDIETNGETTLVLTEEGKLYGWGRNDYGQLGNYATNMNAKISYLTGMTKPVYIGQPVLVCENVKTFSISKYNTYAVLKDGTLVGFGLNNYGQLGIGTVDTDIHDKTVITTDVREVSASRMHVIIRKNDYSVWGFGENYYGEVSGAEWIKGNQAVLSPVKIMDLSGGIATDTSPAISKISVPSAWAQEIVSQADTAGMVPNSLKQNYQANITRAQFAELMVQTIELSGFELPKGQTFSDCTYDYVLKAREAGIVNGTGDNKFNPNGQITRQELVVMLMNAVKYMEQMGGYGDVDDENEALFADVGDWAKDAMKSAYARGYIQGNTTGLNPGGNATCEQAIIMAWRAAQTYFDMMGVAH